MPNERFIRGPILNPRDDGSLEFIADGALLGRDNGRVEMVGPWEHVLRAIGASLPFRRSDGIICPAFLDAHIHIPQHPIRGKFMDGVESDPPGGRLIAGLHRNVFPAERRCEDQEHAERTIRQFLEDTLAHGVVGGAAYMTVHYAATVRALEILPETWSVGLVLMNRNCPEYLRNDERHVERHLTELAERFGRRAIVTDRFAVAVTSELRRRAAKLAERFGLMTQTHLNEQVHEKDLVERSLHPEADSYTHVYARDRLLEGTAILAHCIHVRDDELDLIHHHGAVIAHCPTSNTLLGSGIMPLDRIRERGIEYAICTDVGASPTTSLLAEMAQFLKVHAGRSRRATTAEALYRTTLAAARLLGHGDRLGSFRPGKEFTFVEIDPLDMDLSSADGDRVLRELLFGRSISPEERFAEALSELERVASGGTPDLDLLTAAFARTASRLDRVVARVTVRGMVAWERSTTGSPAESGRLVPDAGV